MFASIEDTLRRGFPGSYMSGNDRPRPDIKRAPKGGGKGENKGGGKVPKEQQSDYPKGS